MIHFNELRITPDSKHLIIDASIDNSSYYDNVVLDSIIIDTQDNYVANGPSSKPIYTYKIDTQSKHIRLIISDKNLGISLNENMFFVYAIATGTPAPDTPCGMDNSVIMSTVVNLYPIYQNTMCYLRELDSDCQVPKGFIDMILRLKALELCVRTGNYTKAISYWKKFFLGKTQVPTYNCGCNGRTN